MFAAKLLLATVLLVGVSARHVPMEEVPYGFDQEYIYPDDVDQDFQYTHPGYLASIGRVRRQAQGTLTLNSDGSTGVVGKIPITGNERNVLSAVGKLDLNNQMQPSSKGIGLAFDNVKGHGLTVMKETVPGFGSKLTGAGQVTVLNDNGHKLGLNAFATKNMPTNYPGVPNFNTVGGGVDYMFNNKVGASLGMAQTPFLDRKDYSAMGNLNVFRTPTSSVDFSGGFKRIDSPMLSTGWKPSFMFNFGKSF